MNKKNSSRAKHLDFIIIDILCVELAFLLAVRIRFKSFNAVPSQDIYRLINGAIILAHLMIVFLSEEYSGILRRGYIKEIKSVLQHNLLMLAVVLTLLFFSKSSEDYSRLMIGYFVLINAGLMYMVRVLLKHVVYRRNRKSRKLQRLLMIAKKENADRLLDQLLGFEYGGFQIDGVILTDGENYENKTHHVAGVATKEEMYQYALNRVVDGVVIDGKIENKLEISKKYLEMGIAVYISMNEVFQDLPNTEMEKLNLCPVLSARINRMSFKQRFFKRATDIIAGLIGTVITALLVVILGPAIYIQSPGPIFFKQVRVGRNGRKFNIYKFRSMYPDAEERKKELMKNNEMQGFMFKMEDDPRIFPLGKFIRKTSLDEFPQFINILKGDMSLVGTRPPTVDEYEKYELHHKSRLAIKPGLTGMWQTSGRSEITDFEEVVRLDNEYIRHFCLSLDLKIILKTFKVVLSREGSK